MPAKTTGKKRQPADSNRVQFRATLDVKSEEYLDSLARHLETKRGPLVAELIASLDKNKKLTAQLVEFYRNVWPIIEPRQIKTGRLFNWPVEVDDALKHLSWSSIGTGNKSEMVRVLIAFFASHHKVVEIPERR